MNPRLRPRRTTRRGADIRLVDDVRIKRHGIWDDDRSSYASLDFPLSDLDLVTLPPRSPPSLSPSLTLVSVLAPLSGADDVEFDAPVTTSSSSSQSTDSIGASRSSTIFADEEGYRVEPLGLTFRGVGIRLSNARSSSPNSYSSAGSARAEVGR